jgi:hypothetical protein
MGHVDPPCRTPLLAALLLNALCCVLVAPHLLFGLPINGEVAGTVALAALLASVAYARRDRIAAGRGSGGAGLGRGTRRPGMSAAPSA